MAKYYSEGHLRECESSSALKEANERAKAALESAAQRAESRGDEREVLTLRLALLYIQPSLRPPQCHDPGDDQIAHRFREKRREFEERGWSLSELVPKHWYLVGRDISNFDFRGLNFEGMDLTRTKVKGANFKGANLKGSTFNFADIRGANFAGADLREASFLGAITEAGIVSSHAAGQEGGVNWHVMRTLEGETLVCLDHFQTTMSDFLSLVGGGGAPDGSDPGKWSSCISGCVKSIMMAAENLRPGV